MFASSQQVARGTRAAIGLLHEVSGDFIKEEQLVVKPKVFTLSVETIRALEATVLDGVPGGRQPTFEAACEADARGRRGRPFRSRYCL